nr:MICOS complex subunit MIC60 isoform X1 [Tanacetum cinerariifolium]
KSLITSDVKLKKVAEAVKGAHDVKVTDDVGMSNDKKLVLDFLQANVAEKRQANLDAYIYSEEKRMMKRKLKRRIKPPKRYEGSVSVTSKRNDSEHETSNDEGSMEDQLNENPDSVDGDSSMRNNLDKMMVELNHMLTW